MESSARAPNPKMPFCPATAEEKIGKLPGGGMGKNGVMLDARTSKLRRELPVNRGPLQLVPKFNPARMDCANCPGCADVVIDWAEFETLDTLPGGAGGTAGRLNSVGIGKKPAGTLKPSMVRSELMKTGKVELWMLVLVKPLPSTLTVAAGARPRSKSKKPETRRPVRSANWVRELPLNAGLKPEADPVVMVPVKLRR